MTSLSEIKNWSERFPFDEGELEIILRCHAAITSGKGNKGGSFLNILTHSFPYVFFFLPEDELEVRTSLVEEYILPPDFGERFKSALLTTGISNEVQSIENLIDGVANSCRREPKHALSIIFDCCAIDNGTADPSKLVELCYSLAVASNVLVAKRIQEKLIKSFKQSMPSLHGLKASLSKYGSDSNGNVTKSDFIIWGTKAVPFIYSCLPTFIHTLIFHGKATTSHHQEAFVHPELLDDSDIFTATNTSFPYMIGCMAPEMGGKWRRLFSSKMEETPANCLKAAISYHVGPSFFVMKTKSGAVFGGCVESKWKVCYFLFQLEPFGSIYYTSNGQFHINHNDCYTNNEREIKGFGFYDEENDDANKWNTSHLFFSTSCDVCIASFMNDKPEDIETFEVWGFGEQLYD